MSTSNKTRRVKHVRIPSRRSRVERFNRVPNTYPVRLKTTARDVIRGCPRKKLVRGTPMSRSVLAKIEIRCCEYGKTAFLFPDNPFAYPGANLFRFRFTSFEERTKREFRPVSEKTKTLRAFFFEHNTLNLKYYCLVKWVK